MLRAVLFGEMRIEVDGRPVPPLPSRPRAVLAYLLLHPTAHPRTRLAGRFWPDVLETSARASLRSALWAVKAALDTVGGGDYLLAERATVGINPDLPRDVDVEVFAHLLATGDVTSLERAAGLGAGRLLTDLADEWVLDAQDAHRDRLVDALMRLAAAAEGAGDVPTAIGWVRRAVEQERLRESLHRELMRLLVASGEPGEALAVYARLRGMMSAELGLAPSAETRALARELRAGAAETLAPEHDAPVAGVAITGRDAELAALGAAWSQARGGSGGLVAITGEAGIGKSTLLDALCAHALADGALVIRGRALALDGAPPLAPWTDAIADLARAVTPPTLDGFGGELARLSPSVEARWGCAPAPSLGAPDLERARTFDAVVAALEACAAKRPVLVALEDLHAADPESLALTAHVAKRVAGMPVLLAATARASDASEFGRMVGALTGAGVPVSDVVVGPCGPGVVASLVTEAFPDLPAEGVETAIGVCDGNPLLAVLAARGIADGRSPTDGVRGFARTTLRSLAPDAATLAGLAAVAGRDLEPAEAAALVGDQLDGAFDACRRAGALRRAGQRRIGFVHDLVREAWAAEIPEVDRADLHLRLADMLAERPDRQAAEVALHYRLAGEPTRARVFLAAAAGEARAVGAIDAAARHLEDALGLADAFDRESVELWLGLADLEAWRGRRSRMDDAFDAAIAALDRVGDLPARAGAFASRSRWLHTTLCYPADALEAGRTALSLLDAARIDAPEVRQLALAGVAWAESVAGDPQAVPGLIAQAGEPADVVLAAELQQAAATALIRQGEMEAGIAAAESAALVARHAGRPDVAALALLLAAAAHACRGGLTEVLAACDRIDSWPSPGPSLELQVGAARAHALSRLERHGEAVAVATALAARARELVAGGIADFDLGTILLAAGEPAPAAAAFRTALEGEGAIPRVLARLGLAEALALAGDRAAAGSELALAPFEPVGAQDVPQTLAARLARVQGLVAAAAGDVETAERRLAEARAAWVRLGPLVSAGDAFAGNLVDLGRPPVAGLVDVDEEIARLDRELAAVGQSAERSRRW